MPTVLLRRIGVQIGQKEANEVKMKTDRIHVWHAMCIPISFMIGLMIYINVHVSYRGINLQIKKNKTPCNRLKQPGI